MAVEKTPEQVDAVQRRALPVAVGGSLCAAGIALGLLTQISAFNPPSFLAMNLAFCAILIGVGILVYANGTPGTGGAAVFSLAAILMGLSGTAIYARKAVRFREACESRETDNLTDIAGAARKYALAHGGVYPADLLVLLDAQMIKPENLQSPYGMHDPVFNDFAVEQKAAKSREDLLHDIETRSDYLFMGADLKNVPAELEAKIITVASANVVLHEEISVAFASARAEFLDEDDVDPARKASDDARATLGLGPMELPANVQKALDDAAAQKKGG